MSDKRFPMLNIKKNYETYYRSARLRVLTSFNKFWTIPSLFNHFFIYFHWSSWAISGYLRIPLSGFKYQGARRSMREQNIAIWNFSLFPTDTSYRGARAPKNYLTSKYIIQINHYYFDRMVYRRVLISLLIYGC